MNHICFDHRLNVEMTSLTTTHLNPVIEFQMRVFRFRDPTEPAHKKQEQDIVCEIYLEESESTYEEKPCECYTPDECIPFTQTETTPNTTTPITTTLFNGTQTATTPIITTPIVTTSTQLQTETSSITTTQNTTTPSSPSPGMI